MGFLSEEQFKRFRESILSSAFFDRIGPTTTKGDLATRDADIGARLGVGADGKFLKAKASEATGLEWGDAPVKGTQILGFTGAGSIIIIPKGGADYEIGLTGVAVATGIGAQNDWKAQAAGTIKNLRVYVKNSSVMNADGHVWLFKAGVATALTVTIDNTDSSSWVEDTVNNFTVAAGDLVRFVADNDSSGGGAKDMTLSSITCEFVPT